MTECSVEGCPAPAIVRVLGDADEPYRCANCLEADLSSGVVG